MFNVEYKGSLLILVKVLKPVKYKMGCNKEVFHLVAPLYFPYSILIHKSVLIFCYFMTWVKKGFSLFSPVSVLTHTWVLESRGPYEISL